MAYLRLLHKRDWHPKKERFTRLAFRNPSQSLGYHGKVGISVIDDECGKKKTGCVCDHIELHYEKWPKPTMVWIVAIERIPGFQAVQTPSGTDLNCHYDLQDVPDSLAEKAFNADHEEKKFKNYRLCNGSVGLSAVTDEMLLQWKTAHDIPEKPG